MTGGIFHVKVKNSYTTDGSGNDHREYSVKEADRLGRRMLEGGSVFIQNRKSHSSHHLKRRSEDEKVSLEQELKGNAYPGKGNCDRRIKDGTKAVTGYFIMGRSQNSRNRVFVEEGGESAHRRLIRSKLEDPSLIIYAPVRVLGNDTIVTNGDRYHGIRRGNWEGRGGRNVLRYPFETREFEPDAPTTPQYFRCDAGGERNVRLPDVDLKEQ